ncbi:thioester domain-containing protein [Arcanobacterium haemolyticum]
MSSHSRTRRILATLSAIAFAFVPSTLANAAENKPAIPKVQYQIERSDGDDLGYYLPLKSGTSGHNRMRPVTPQLFRVNSTGATAAEYRAYCIEFFVTAIKGKYAIPEDWTTFKANNRFKNDDVRQKIAWIIQHSYPAMTLDKLMEATQLTGVDARQAISATQAAIWHLTDGIEFNFRGAYAYNQWQGKPVVVDGSVAANMEKLYSYLLSSSNTGLTEEQIRPEFTLSSHTVGFTAGSLVGPIKLTTSVTPQKIDVSDGLKLTDKEGKEITVERIAKGEEFYVDARQKTGNGSVNIKATFAAKPTYSGTILSPFQYGRRGQSVILIEEKSNNETAGISASWEGGKSETITERGEIVDIVEDTAPPVKGRADVVETTEDTKPTPGKNTGKTEEKKPQAKDGKPKASAVSPVLAKSGINNGLAIAFFAGGVLTLGAILLLVRKYMKR